MKYLRLLLFILPLGFLSLSFIYRDTTYLFFAAVSFLFAGLINKPKFLSNKKLALPSLKRQLRSVHIDKQSFDVGEILETTTKGREKLIFILVSALIFTVFFTFIAVNTLPTLSTVKNFIPEYYVSQLINLKQTGIYLVLLMFVLVLIGSNYKSYHKTHRLSIKFKRPQLINYFVLTSTSLIFGFLISLLALYIYGIAQLNIAVMEIKTSPNSVGIVYGKKAINDKLKSMTTAPNVIGTYTDPSNTILSIIINGSSQNNNFFQQRIIKTIPHFLVMPFTIKNQSVFMVKNTLIISSIDKDIMQTISPTLARLLLKSYFKNRDLKDDPTISILNRQEYLAFRQDEINKRVAQIKVVIQKVEDYISGLYGDISNAKQKIAANQSAIDSTSSNKDYYYNNCMNAGYDDYFTGTFYHYYSQSYCDSIKSQADQDIAQYQQNINGWNSTLRSDQNELAQAQTADQNLKDYAQSIEDSKNSTPDELGIFEGPKHIRVVLDSTSPKGINAFLETLVHENLHYQSYVSEDRNFTFSDDTYDGFWEEGLTEYFARKVVANDLGVNINQGYPLIVKVVAQIAKKIPESELQKIYFTKDESTLEADLDAAYGKDFYKNTEPYFEYLSYLPYDKQLKYANNIMTVIHGKPLTTNDLYSTDMQSQ